MVFLLFLSSHISYYRSPCSYHPSHLSFLRFCDDAGIVQRQGLHSSFLFGCSALLESHVVHSTSHKPLPKYQFIAEEFQDTLFEIYPSIQSFSILSPCFKFPFWHRSHSPALEIPFSSTECLLQLSNKLHKSRDFILFIVVSLVPRTVSDMWQGINKYFLNEWTSSTILLK